MKKLALIGVGRIGLAHLKNIKRMKLKDVEVFAICDIDDNALNNGLRLFPNTKIFKDYLLMIAECKLDGVIIATPHYSHEEIAINLLNNNINTFVEKPITVTVEGADNMIEAAKKSTALFAIDYNQRTNKLYRKAKELVSSSQVGDIVRANFIITDWYRSQSYYNQGGWRATYSGEGGGVLINQCVHQLDILQWIIGMPKMITSSIKTVNREITVENDVTAILHYENFDCVLTASTHELTGTNRLEIAGEKGKIIVDKYNMNYFICKYGEKEVNKSAKSGEYGWDKIKKFEIKNNFFEKIWENTGGQQRKALRMFINAIINGSEPVAYGVDGIKALEIINGIYLSHWLKKTVTLPLDRQQYQSMLAIKIEQEKVNKKSAN